MQFYIDPHMTHHTHAVKPIQPGEELTISYVDAFAARSVRRDRALRSWGFACACAHCSLPDRLARASDDRLWQLYEAENRLAAWGDEDSSSFSSATAPVEMRDVEHLLALYRQEGLDQSHAADVLVHAALNYNAFGEEALAAEYALLAVEAGMLEKGPESRHVKTMTLLLEDPKQHWSWRRRIKG